VFAGLIDLDDIGMLQPGRGFRLGAKPGQAHRPGMRSRQDHFQRDDALQAKVPRLIDHAHAAATELFQDLVTGNDLAFQRVRVRGQRLADRHGQQPSRFLVVTGLIGAP